MCITRRHLLLTGTVCAATGLLPTKSSAQDSLQASSDANEIFICGTDESSVDESVQIRDFSVGQSDAQIQDKLSDHKITDYGTAFLANRWLPEDAPDGRPGIITLGCFFVSGSAQDRRDVQQWAAEWLQQGVERLLDFDFNVSQEQSHIRIMLGATVNESAIGRDALNFRKDQPTMKIFNITRATVQHEFGHAIGLRHEHQNPGGSFRLIEEAVIREMSQPPNSWSEANIRRYIINRWSTDAMCIGDPNFNRHSVMMYDLPGRWVEGGQSLRRSNRISDRDLACVRGLYSV